jgi:hypothetical protein
MARTILNALLAALLTAGAAIAQEPTQRRDRVRDPATHAPGTTAPDRLQVRQADRDRIHQLLRTEGGLTPEQVTAMRPEVDEYLSRGGDVARMQETVRAALQNGCRGECLGEAVRQTNGLMARGYAPLQAGEAVRAAMQEEGRGQGRQGADDADAAQRLRARVQDRVRDPDLDRDRDRARDQDRERDRDRDMTHQPGGAPAPRGRR